MRDQEAFPNQFDADGTPICPTCGRTFSAIGVMRAHHSRSHGERLANRRCEGCGTTFYDPKGELQFCDGCNPYAGENNGNWKDAKVKGECIVCRGSFQYYPSEKPGRYCSDCYADPEVSGNPPQEWWGDGSRTVDCEYCGAEFTVYRWKAENQDEFFCDRDCYSRWLSESKRLDQTAPDNYGAGWRPARRRALERDDHTCQRCGIDEDGLDASLDVHHIRPLRDFDEPNEAHSLDNLVTVCRSCHQKVEWYDGEL